jgi:hypothetical protein
VSVRSVESAPPMSTRLRAGLRRALAPLLDPAATPLAGAIGLGAIAGAYALNREGTPGSSASLLFWSGLLIILAPVAAHLLGTAATRTDRIALLVYAAAASYAVKVLHDPSSFTFSDEFVHYSAAEQLQHTHAVLGVLNVAGSTVANDYPGMHAAAVAVSDVTTLPLFASGLIVIGIARVLLLLGLFVLFERVSGSERQASIGALLYMASANFLFFTAQFSYESLSLPLFVVVLAITISLPGTPRRSQIPLALCATLMIGAITVTHHLTSYALAATFAAVTLLAIRSAWRGTRAATLTLVAAASATTWYFFVATATGPYLGYVLRRTVKALTDTQSGGTRKPFQDDSGLQTPVTERLVAVLSAAIVCLAVIWALRQLWRERQPVSAPGAMLIAAATAFLALFPLKVLPGAWETANRSSDFLFIGVAFVVAAVLTHKTRSGRQRVAMTALILATICGGVIQGWPSQLRLAHPLQARVGGATVTAEGLTAARWATRHLSATSVYLADEASGRELAVDGAFRVFPGRAIDAPDLFASSTLPIWQRDRLVRNRIDYVVLDRRKISANNLAGYFLQPTDDPGGGLGFYSAGVRRKFERVPRSSTVYDSGDIAIIDLRGLRGGVPLCALVADRTWSEPFSCLRGSTIERFAGADDVARLTRARVAVLQTRLEARVSGLHVTIGVLIRNLSRRPLAPDPSFTGYSLKVDGQRVERVHRTANLRGNLGAHTSVAPSRQIERSLTFVLDAAQARALQRDGGVLTLRQRAGASSRAESGHIRLRPPFEGAPA